jgi:hypothetical protein
MISCRGGAPCKSKANSLRSVEEIPACAAQENGIMGYGVEKVTL